MIEVRNLTVKRGARVVLNVPHLSLPRGKSLSLVGPNGAGKSTLLLTLARLLKPHSGEVILDDRPAAGEPDVVYRRRLGLVMQNPLLFDTSVFENVALGLRFRATEKQETHARVMRWLDRLGIAHLANRRASELSGGEAQRVSLARAFVVQPELLLMDEPFAALDAPTRRQLFAQLTDILRETNTTTLFVTHHVQEAITLGDALAVLVDGQLVQHGAVRDVLANPATPAVRDFFVAQQLDA